MRFRQVRTGAIGRFRDAPRSFVVSLSRAKVRLSEAAGARPGLPAHRKVAVRRRHDQGGEGVRAAHAVVRKPTGIAGARALPNRRNP
ncbi:hypothetical protein LG3211_1582 [Lysobacter gummosus]|nr:hypothetical protein LG3211_1582 [Lysobacter gummosus]